MFRKNSTLSSTYRGKFNINTLSFYDGKIIVCFSGYFVWNKASTIDFHDRNVLENFDLLNFRDAGL